MKKSLFALAAVGAFAGAAQAQSSVTVYGILDVGYTGGTNMVNGAVTNVSRISNSMESGSRLGFRGNEDLGGGTSAQFTFELGMQPAGNAGSNPTGANRTATDMSAGTYQGQGSTVWNPDVRQAFVGLTQKGMGTIRIGTQNTLFWEQGGSNTAGQLSQTIGSVLTPSTVGAFFDNGATATTAAAGNSASYTVRTTNTVTVRTERMAGVVAKAAYTLSNQTSPRTGGANGGYTGGVSDQDGWQVALDWRVAKANIQASYAQFNSQNPFTCTATPCTGTNVASAGRVGSWGTGAQGSNVKDGQALITASYDFGILTAYAGWTQRSLTSQINGDDKLTRSAQEIGVRGYVTKTIEGWAMGGTGRWKAQGGPGIPTANFVGYQIGTNYWMSKRTNLYAIYGSTSTSSTSSGSYSLGQYSLGVRHTF